MSESSIGISVRERATAADPVEVRLVFSSRDYSLTELKQRISEVEALMVLLMGSQDLVMRPRPLEKKFRPNRGRILQGRVVTASSSFYGDVLDLIVIKKLSLQSPLDVVLTIAAASSAALALVVRYVPRLIEIKNQIHESTVISAKARRDKGNLRLEAAVTEVLANEIQNLDMTKYSALPATHPTKLLVKQGVRALAAIDKAEVKE